MQKHGNCYKIYPNFLFATLTSLDRQKCAFFLLKGETAGKEATSILLAVILPHCFNQAFKLTRKLNMT